MTSKFIKNKFTIFALVIIFIIGFNYLSFNYLIKSFISLETKENQKILTSLITYIDSRFETINITASDYGQWDETYEFIQDKNEDYIYQNFRDKTATLENVKLNFMIFANLENEIIYAQTTDDLNIDDKNNFSKQIINSLNKDGKFSIVKYKDRYFYVAKAEILKSDSSGELRGYVYAGKKFTLEEFPHDDKNKILFVDKLITTPDMALKSEFIDSINVHFNYTKDTLSNVISFKNTNKDLLTIKLEYDRQIYKPSKKQIILFNGTVSIFIIILFFIFYFYVKTHEKLNEELKIKVEEEVKKQKAQEEILIHQSRSAEIGEMINNIAHQWRQPLNNLTLNIQNIGFSYENGVLTQETLDQTIDKSKKIINSMSNTIDTFRDFFAPNKNKNLFKIEHSIDNTIEILSSTLRFHSIELSKEIIDDIETYDYENEFSQVLLNIITNSKDALVSNKIEHPQIKIIVRKFENRLILEIKDNAKGIDEKIINKIFEPYFTTKEKGEGTGIGLYMSKLIIEKNMNGKIEVKNDKDGAIFKITLKIAKEEI